MKASRAEQHHRIDTYRALSDLTILSSRGESGAKRSGGAAFSRPGASLDLVVECERVPAVRLVCNLRLVMPAAQLAGPGAWCLRLGEEIAARHRRALVHDEAARAAMNAAGPSSAAAATSRAVVLVPSMSPWNVFVMPEREVPLVRRFHDAIQ